MKLLLKNIRENYNKEEKQEEDNLQDYNYFNLLNAVNLYLNTKKLLVKSLINYY